MGEGLLFQPAKVEASLARPSGMRVPVRPLPPEKVDGVVYFLDCIRQDKPIEDPASAELNVGVNEIIDAAIESIRTGSAVSLKP
jgi:predicted dehydrogenase